MKQKIILAILILVLFEICGCSSNMQSIKQTEKSELTLHISDRDVYEKSKKIAECYREIYEQAVDDKALENLDTIKRIVKCLGSSGYTVVDYENQVDMVNPDKVEEFVGHIEKKEDAKLMILCILNNGGFVRYDLESVQGSVEVVQSTLSWNDKTPEVNYKVEYPAYAWVYSREGYLFFEQYHMPGICFGHTAIRVQALDESCRELNRKYIRPIGYRLNNMFISDWSEDNYHDLDFYDLYDIIFRLKYKKYVPYKASDDRAIYKIPKGDFEDILKAYFCIEEQILQEKTTYHRESSTYEYRPRGLSDCGSGMEIPYPEVISYKENQDGTLTLTVNVVWAEEKLASAFCHEVMVRPLANGEFQYVSNHIIPSDDNAKPTWYIDRLTYEQWAEYYGEQE